MIFFLIMTAICSVRHYHVSDQCFESILIRHNFRFKAVDFCPNIPEVAPKSSPQILTSSRRQKNGILEIRLIDTIKVHVFYEGNKN